MAQRPVDPDKLKEFMQNRKKRSAEEQVEVIEVVEVIDEDAGKTNAPGEPTPASENIFGNLPEFHHVGVPPIRRPSPAPAPRTTQPAARNATGPSSEKINELHELLQQLRVLGWVCTIFLTLLLILQLTTPMLRLLNPVEYDYMVYDLREETQNEIKDNLKIDGWELVTINAGSVIYKRPR